MKTVRMKMLAWAGGRKFEVNFHVSLVHRIEDLPRRCLTTVNKDQQEERNKHRPRWFGFHLCWGCKCVATVSQYTNFAECVTLTGRRRYQEWNPRTCHMIKGSNEYSKIWNRSLVLWYLILFNNYLRCTKAWLRSRCFQLKSRERIMTKAEKQITTRLKHFGGCLWQKCNFSNALHQQDFEHFRISPRKPCKLQHFMLKIHNKWDVLTSLGKSLDILALHL